MPLASFSTTITLTSKEKPPDSVASLVTLSSKFQPGKPLAPFASNIKLNSTFRGDSGDLFAGRYRE